MDWKDTHNPQYCIEQRGAEFVRVCHKLKHSSSDYSYCKCTKYCQEYCKIWMSKHEPRDIDKNVLGEVVKF